MQFSRPLWVYPPTTLHSSLTRIFHFLAFIPNASIQSSFSRPQRIKTAFFPHLVLLSLVRVFYLFDPVPNVGISPFSCRFCQNTTLSCRKITTRQKIHFSWQWMKNNKHLISSELQTTSNPLQTIVNIFKYFLTFWWCQNRRTWVGFEY